MLKDKLETDLETCRIKWSEKLGENLEQETWKNILQNIPKSTPDLRLRWMQQKIIMDLYWYPTKMLHLKLSDSDICWNCKSSQGSFIHMIWLCPKIHTFWDNIFFRIKLIINADINKDPKLAILGDTSNLKEILTPNIKWIITALNCAKIIIFRGWKAHTTPNVESWLNDLSTLASMEKTLALRLKCSDKHQKKWSKFLDLYTN